MHFMCMGLQKHFEKIKFLNYGVWIIEIKHPMDGKDTLYVIAYKQGVIK